jgi:hypothetical protein
MPSSSNRRPRWLRQICAATLAVAALLLAGAPTATAAIPPPGSIVATQSSAVALTTAAPGTACEGQVSSGSFVTAAGTLYSNNPVASPVGARFWVKITTANLSTCSAGAGVALQLPAGVALAFNGGPGPVGVAVTCKRLDPTSQSRPVNETIFRSPQDCPQSPPVVNGHLVLNPPGTPGWATRPSGNFTQNQIEIFVWLRASTHGLKTFTARVCDLQGPACTGNPPRNASMSISANITG